MCDIIYFSRSGNTKKVATAIAEEFGNKVRHIRTVESLPEGADVFLGSGLYFMRPSKLVRQFIRNNDFHGKKVAIFGTSTSGIGIETIGMEWLLKRKGAIIVGKFYCPGRFFLRIAGKFLFIRKGRPEEKDLEKARVFARSIRNTFEIEPGIEIQEPTHEERILSRV
jgi:flavodoxin